jgi:apolipoprotein N-acyltransferase
MTRATIVVPAACVTAGLALALAQPGFDRWPLAWFALVPLLLVMRGASPGRAFRLGWLAGWAYYGAILYWIAPTIATYTRIEMPLAIVLELMLAAVAGLSIGAFAAAVEWLAGAGISRIVAAPAAWVVLDWLRTFFPAAFPWGFLGYSQVPVAPVIQLADVAGIYGVTALLVSCNVALAEVARDGFARHRGLVAVQVCVVLAVVGYGAVRLSHVASLKGSALRVALVQGNIAQDVKWRHGLDEVIFARHMALSERAVAEGARLVVWPEAAIPFFVNIDPRSRRLSDFTRRHDVALLAGAPGYDHRAGDKPRQYNQAWLVDPGGALHGPYDKIRLVPFGEYVPWGGLFGLVQKAVEGIGDFGAGDTYTVFEAPAAAGAAVPTRAAALICYEAIFPDLTRRFVRAGAELLVNVSNDAWYGRTAAPYQLLAMVAVRAVENRVPVVRATNTGVTAMISPAGEIRGQAPLFEEAVVVDDVELLRTFSLYTVLGDWLVYVSLVLLFALTVVRLRSGSVLIPDGRRGILSR